MNLFINLSITALLLTLCVPSYSTETHREHSAHVHGAGKMGLAFEKEKGRIEIRIAADSVIGFEHEAKTDNDKASVKKATEDFDGKILSLIQFDKALECSISKRDLRIERESGQQKSSHSNFVANFDLICKKEIKGSSIVIDFSSYNKIKDLDVDILADDVQLEVEFKGSPVKVKIQN